MQNDRLFVRNTARRCADARGEHVGVNYGGGPDTPERIIVAAHQRSELEAELQYSAERYVLAMRISDDGPWEWNFQTDEFVLSPRWKCMRGCCDEEC